jgi:hypothetical protein
VKCGRPAIRAVRYTNVFGEDARSWFCGDHAEEFVEPAFQKKALDEATFALGVMSSAGLMKSSQGRTAYPEVQQLLNEHRESCQLCARVRDWVHMEAAEGRIRTEADVDRVGRYATHHSCSRGHELALMIGQAMTGTA